MCDTSMMIVYLVTLIVYAVLIVIIELRHGAERRDLYDRLMSTDISQYKAYCDDGNAEQKHVETAHERAIRRFEESGRK